MYMTRIIVYHICTCNMKNWSFVLLFIYKSKSISFLFQNSGMKNNMCIHVYYMYLTSFRLSVDFYFKHCFPIAQGNSVCKNMVEYTCTVNGHKYSPPSILRYIFHIKPQFSKKILWSHYNVNCCSARLKNHNIYLCLKI
jgi:hypothetical protein